MFAVHCSSGHESLEGCVSKSQLSQQKVVPRVTAEEVSHHSNKSQLIVPKIGEMGGEKCKTSRDSYLSVNKHRNSVTESSAQQSNCSKQTVCGSMKNKASDATVQQSDDQQFVVLAISDYNLRFGCFSSSHLVKHLWNILKCLLLVIL